MEKIRIGDVCEILNGYAFKSEQYVEDGIRIVRIANVQKGYIEDSSPVFYPENTDGLDKYMLNKGDLLMSLTGNVGRVALLTEEFLPAALNQRVACLRLKTDEISRSFIYHYLNSDLFERLCVQSSKGVAQKNMSTEWLKEYKIPLYSRDEQKTIVSVLDRVSTIINLRKQELDELDNLIKSRFVKLFGNIIVNSKEWPVYELSEISSSRLGKMLDEKQQTGLYKYPYLANYNVQWFEFVLDNLNEMDFYPKDLIEFELRDGDLLVTEGGEVGRCAVWKEQIDKCYFQKALHRVRCDLDIIVPEYLARVFKLKADHNKFEDIVGSKSTISHLTGVKLKKIPVPVPPIYLQNEFKEFIERVDKLKIVVQTSLDDSQTLFDSLMQDYFD